MSIQIFTKLTSTILQKGNSKRILVAQNFKFPLRQLSLKINKKTDSPKTLQIYYGPLAPHIRGVKIFSLTTSVAGLAAQPVLIKHLSSLESLPLILVFGSFVGFFTLITPFLLHFVTKKYVTKLHYQPETKTYIATTLNFFIKEKQLEFKPEDVRVPDVLGVFTSFHVKGKPLFIDPKLFEDPTYYGNIMGYDKPLDLKLFQTSLNEKNKCK